MYNKNPSLPELRQARLLHNNSLLSLQNVCGTALGGKRRKNQKTGERAVIVFVKNKISESMMEGQAVPKLLRGTNSKILTDVIELQGVETQYGQAPFFSYDGMSQGTITAFCISYGNFYASTCAHCMKGLDLDPFEASDMQLYHPEMERYLTVGSSAFAIKAPGRGLQGHYGFSDAGLFTIEDHELLARCKKGKAIKCWNNPRTNSSVYAKTANGLLEGTIEFVEAQYGNIFTDIIIRINKSGTFVGDSGVLWRTNNGLGVAIHALGSTETNGEGSKMSFGMFANRIALEMNATFIDI